MWIATYEQVFKGVSKEAIWSAWTDVNNWTRWDKDLEEVVLKDSFAVGSNFFLKPKGGPRVSIAITEIQPLKVFVDATSFPLAKMYDYHELEETGEGLKIKSKIWTEGILGWVWRKIVAENVAKGVPEQMERLVEYAKRKQSET